MASIREHTKKGGATTFYVLWRDPELGKQTSMSVPTREKAEALRDLLNESNQRLSVVNQKLTPAPAPDALTLRRLFEHHLERLTRPTEGTIAGYRRLFNNRINDEFGDMLADEFTDEVISRWVKERMASGVTRKTMANTTGLLSSAYKTAMRHGLVALNPFEFIELPSDNRPGRRAVFLTKKEFDLLFARMNPWYRNMVETDLNTGLRFGEITALNRGDLLLDEKIPIINVDKAWKEDGRRHKFIGTPKSATGVRTVSITEALVKMLEPLKDRNGLLFTTLRGAPITSKVFHRDAWQKAVTAAKEDGLRKTPRFHDLRHTHASWLLQEGVPIFVVSRRLGHASVDVTTKLYGHITPEGHRRAVRGLERALKR